MMDETSTRLQNTVCRPCMESEDSQCNQSRENITDSGCSANRILLDETFSVTICKGNAQHENTFNIAPNDEPKIINEDAFREQRTFHILLQEGGGHGNRSSCRNICPRESLQISPRCDSTGEYVAANASSETDNTIHASCQRRLSNSSCSMQQTPERQASPRSDIVLDSPVNALHRMCVEMSVLHTSIPIHGYPSQSESVALQGRQTACSTPKSRSSISVRRLLPSPSHNCEDNASAKTKQEGDNIDNLREERDRVKSLIEKQKEEYFNKRRPLEELQAKTLEQKRALEKQIADQDKKQETLHELMVEYEKVISDIVEQKETAEQEFQARKEELDRVIEETQLHIKNQEITNLDLRSKYDKNRYWFLTFEDRYENNVQRVEELREELKQREEKYENLKSRAAGELQRCNEMWNFERRNQQTEITKLKAVVKRLEISISSSEELIAQRTKEAEKLLRIHRELQEELCGGMAPRSFRFLSSDESDESGIHM